MLEDSNYRLRIESKIKNIKEPLNKQSVQNFKWSHPIENKMH